MPEGDLEVWAGPLMSGQFAVILLNRSENEAEITFQFEDCGLRKDDTAMIRDIWAHQDITTAQSSYTMKGVPRHGVKFLILTPIIN